MVKIMIATLYVFMLLSGLVSVSDEKNPGAVFIFGISSCMILLMLYLAKAF